MPDGLVIVADPPDIVPEECGSKVNGIDDLRVILGIGGLTVGAEGVLVC